ncbi:MAG: peptidoglycan DD-metalloendopeptidase family protein [Candidatus Flexifilum sp.]
MGRQGGLPAFLLILVALIGFGYVLWQNAQPVPALRVIVPTERQPTEAINSWQSVLREGFGADSTPLPTVAIPTAPFIPPTLPIANPAVLQPIEAASVFSGEATAAPAVGVTPTPPPPTIAPLSTVVPLTAVFVTRPPQNWQPPPLIPPLSRDPLGRDHYWFVRPVDSNANNQGLFYYPYGSDGPENNLRIHAGIDMPNPIGETVRAAGSGVVTWAGDNFQDTFSYGNVVRIEHDFGYDGQPLYTIYAHLSAVLVVPGQVVRAGDPIGLVGNTGRVSGPHVHFEVRMGEDFYGSTYNPLLWMVPYVGTGTIAGRVLDRSGAPVMDADVTIREFARGLVIDTTTTYIFQGTRIDVNSDPAWGENFVVGDVPVGRYDVIAVIDGERVTARVNVIEGTTAFVELRPGGGTPASP